jgi:hypothetical protein
MTGFVLRIIAMVTMLGDHIACNFLDNQIVMRSFGRIAFPIYALLLAEGFLIYCKDKDRVLKHISSLIVLIVVSEFFYDLMESGLDFSSYFGSQNNILTLLLGFFGMLITEELIPRGKKSKKDYRTIFVLISSYLLLGFTNYMVKGNFNLVGPWLVIAFYWFLRLSRDPKTNENKWKWWKRFAVLMLIFAIYVPFYFWVRTDFGSFSSWVQKMKDYYPWIIGHIGAALVLSLYNGKLGYNNKWFKKLYISFYPLHACILGIIRVITGS